MWLLNAAAKSRDERRNLWVVCEERALKVEWGAETLTRLSWERDGKHLGVAVGLVAIGVLFASGVDDGSAGRAGQVATEVVAKSAVSADEQNDRWLGVIMCRNHLSGAVQEALQRKTGQSAATSDCTAETRRENRVRRRQGHLDILQLYRSALGRCEPPSSR